MNQAILSSNDYQISAEGYLIDNRAWQAEIKRRYDLLQSNNETLGGVEEIPMPFTPTDINQLSQVDETVSNDLSDGVTSKEITVAEQTLRDIEARAFQIEKEAYEKAEQIKFEAVQEKQVLLSKAKSEIEQELTQLKVKAEADGREAGFRQAYQEGLAKGKSDGKSEFEGSVRHWDSIVDKTLSEKKHLLSNMEPTLVSLVGESLYRCLKEEAKLSNDMVVLFVREALQKASDRAVLKVHLNPNDVSIVEQKKNELKLMVGSKNLELLPDARIEQGGCLLETEAGSIDARLSTLVAQTKNVLSAS